MESAFAESVEELCQVVMQGAQLTLEQRVVAVHAGLTRLLAMGPALPIRAAEIRPDVTGPFEDWPGFGSYESYWSVGPLSAPMEPMPSTLSVTLQFVMGQLWTGLERFNSGDVDRAGAVWGLGFETTWGPAGAELVMALHPAVAAYRNDVRETTRSRRRGPRMTTTRRVDGRPFLGVQAEPVQGGLIVRAVHPSGPAAGRLIPGDVVLAVDGCRLDGMSLEEVGPLFVGPIGVERRYEVFRDGETLQVCLIAEEAP